MTKILIETTIIRTGQSGPYSDSVAVYRIEDKSDIKYNETYILKYCTGFLKNAVPLEEAESPFQATYKLEKIGDRIWKYTVTEKYTG